MAQQKNPPRQGAAWIEYVLASDDTADRALAREFQSLGWMFQECLQASLRAAQAEGLTGELWSRQEEQGALLDAIQKRVAERGRELLTAGFTPISVEQSAAWDAQQLHLRSDTVDDPPDSTARH